MFKLEWDKDFNLSMTCELQIPVSADEKLVILSEFKKVLNKFEPFSAWMDNSEVPQEQKKPYERSLINSKVSFQFLYEFMKACRITEKEINEYAEVPF